MDSVGEGEGGKSWENGIETCILSYMKWYTGRIFLFCGSFCYHEKMVQIPSHNKLVLKNIEQSYGLCGRGRGWEDLGEWH